MRGWKTTRLSSPPVCAAVRLAALALTALCLLRSGVADDLKQLSASVFDSSEQEIDKIAKSRTSVEAEEEIAVAKRFIEHGKLLLRAGHTRKAAVYAERLHVQLELIRALVAAAAAAETTAAAKGDVLRLEQRLSSLKQRYRRLYLKVHGEALTDAFPAISEQGP
jgi:hypothetical protein